MTDAIDRILRGLDAHLSGRVWMPEDDWYAAATAIWAKPVGLAPRAVVDCRTTKDVREAIRAARDCDLTLSVRGGGHDFAGRALCDGVVVDLSGMTAVDVDVDKRLARISGGARAADVVVVTDPLHLAPVAGAVGALGMAGFTLGGGYGALIGRFGLALDNLVAAEVVLADGRTVVASEGNEEELYWALRGGGGNFGVVTAMQQRLHALPSVHSGLLIYPFAEADAVFERCVAIASAAPDELTMQLGCVAGPDGAPVVFVVPTWCGRPEEGETQVAPFHGLGTRLSGATATMSYGQSLMFFDRHFDNGKRVFMETCWLPRLDSAGFGVFIDAMKCAVSPGCAIVTHEFKGAASRVPLEATAFGLRRDHVLIEIIAAFDNRLGEGEAQRHRHWTQETLRAFAAIALPGGYPNLLAPDTSAERVAKSYGCNAERLIKAKRHYDPDNVFNSAIPLPAR